VQVFVVNVVASPWVEQNP